MSTISTIMEIGKYVLEAGGLIIEHYPDIWEQLVGNKRSRGAKAFREWAASKAVPASHPSKTERGLGRSKARLERSKQKSGK